jgi:hypothetical protein
LLGHGERVSRVRGDDGDADLDALGPLPGQGDRRHYIGAQRLAEPEAVEPLFLGLDYLLDGPFKVGALDERVDAYAHSCPPRA